MATPLLFSAPMVRAMLDGRKTVTRRALTRARVFGTPERPAWTLAGDKLQRALQNADRWRALGEDGWFWESDAFPWQAPATRTGWMADIGYSIGDLRWVREPWRTHRDFDHLAPRDIPVGSTIQCDATGPTFDEGLSGRSRPGMFMPRWASRLTIRVTGVKVERLQNISEEDAIAEGIAPAPGGWWSGMEGQAGTTPRVAYRLLWNVINGPDAWTANPWVVAITFETIKANVDEVLRREAA